MILKQFKKYFNIKELVDEAVFNKYGEKAWQFIDSKLMESLLVIREGIGKPMFLNDWSYGGKFDERGLRHNLSDLVATKSRIYLSAHMMGKAADFDVHGMKATEVRKWIVDNQDAFPHKIRLERKLNGKEISWVHLDCYDYKKNPKVYLFDI
jgi:hypothetical protein